METLLLIQTITILEKYILNLFILGIIFSALLNIGLILFYKGLDK